MRPQLIKIQQKRYHKNLDALEIKGSSGIPLQPFLIVESSRILEMYVYF
jgi:hypothetical protein